MRHFEPSRRCLLIACLLGSLCLTGGELALDAATGPAIVIGQETADAQGNASVDITFTSAGPSIAALQFDIGYPIQASGLAVSSGSAVNSAGKTISTSDPQAGSRRILIAGLNQNPIGTGVVANLSIQVKPGAAGFYPLLLSNVAASDGSGSAVSVAAGNGGVVVPGNTPPSVLAVANAASYASGAVAPGEMVVIGGTLLGAPGTSTLQIASAGSVSTTLAGARVLFDGLPAPLLYVSQNQVSAIVPYGIDGHSQTSLEVEYLGNRSAPMVVPVAKTAPGIFTMNQSGTGQGAILNQDGTVNGPGNPAAKGSVVSIYATGEGQTAPPGLDGSIVGAGNLRYPVLPVTASIRGQSAEVLYAGSAGNQVAGLLQANVRVPASITADDAAAVAITVGSTSQPGVTIAVR